MNHENIKNDVKNSDLERLWCGLYLTQKQLERVHRHAPSDKAAQTEANQTSLTKGKFFALDSRDDQLAQYTLQSRVLFKRLEIELARALAVQRVTYPIHPL